MNKIITTTAKKDTDFVGIIYHNNIMTITFPIGYNIPNVEIPPTNNQILKIIQSDITTLLKILESSKSNTHQEEGTTTFSFSAANYLINDFFQNGLYQGQTIQNSSLKNGSINWPKTIATKLPIYNNGNYIYTNNIKKSINYSQNEITNIQIYCLNKSFQLLGILYNNYKFSYKKEINTQKSIHFLKKQLQITNKDKDKHLLTNLITFLTGTSLNNINKKEIKIGTPHFHTNWEKILKENSSKILPLQNYLPKAYYKINNSIIYTSKTRPDIIIENKKYIYIIDAKYYQTNTLPQTYDIEKQIFYANYISNQTNKPIINTFILPNTISNQHQFLEYATASVQGSENQNGGKIHTIYVDTKALLQTPVFLLKSILTYLQEKEFENIKK